VKTGHQTEYREGGSYRVSEGLALSLTIQREEGNRGLENSGKTE
jgi:hypothetical protein